MPADETPARISRAEAGDAETLAELRRRFWQDQQAKGLLDPVPALDEASVAALIGRPRTSVFMAWLGSEPIGYLFGQTKLVPGTPPQKVSSVEEVYLAPERRRGAIAGALFAQALEDFRGLETDRVQLRVLAANEEGHRFWSRLGFRPNVTLYELDLHAGGAVSDAAATQ